MRAECVSAKMSYTVLRELWCDYCSKHAYTKWG